jgi:hypothetical protein
MEIAAQRLGAMRRRSQTSLVERREGIRREYSHILGKTTLVGSFKKVTVAERESLKDAAFVQRVTLETEDGFLLPILTLWPPRDGNAKHPAVIALAQTGKDGFLKHRSVEIAELLTAGVAVVLPDLRGTGETRAGDDRGRHSGDTSRSSSELMLGSTMVSARLRDAQAVLAFVQTQLDPIDSKRLAAWGDSFAEPNPPDANFRIPHGVDGRAKNSEPLGGHLALLMALYQHGVQCIYIHGGLSSFESVLENQFVHIPHDIVIPGLLTVGDLPDLAAALAPRPLRLDGLVDGLNRRLAAGAAASIYRPTAESYAVNDAKTEFVVGNDRSPAAKWIIANLRR